MKLLFIKIKVKLFLLFSLFHNGLITPKYYVLYIPKYTTHSIINVLFFSLHILISQNYITTHLFMKKRNVCTDTNPNQIILGTLSIKEKN
jgi:hypothetical protein